jgi:hypothetical protein
MLTLPRLRFSHLTSTLKCILTTCLEMILVTARQISDIAIASTFGY